jgi:uncharacterized protein YggE
MDKENYIANLSRLFKYGAVLLGILSLFLIAQILFTIKSYSYIGKDVAPNNVITVAGEGEVFAIPDIATFSFGAQAEAKTVSEAQDVVTRKMNNALSILKKAGIEDKDVKTTDYNVYPQYEYKQTICTSIGCPPGTQVLKGYQVSQMVSVKVRKVADAGKILGSLGSAEVTNLSGLQFTIDDEDALKAEARAKAIADAKQKATVLARDLGVKLVGIVNFSENGNNPMPMYKLGMEADGRGVAASAPTPEVPAGQNKIVSDVTITYEIH